MACLSLTDTLPMQNAEKYWLAIKGIPIFCTSFFSYNTGSKSPPGLPAFAQASRLNPLHAQTSPVDRLQLTWSTIFCTSGVAGLVSVKPPGVGTIVAGNFSEVMVVLKREVQRSLSRVTRHLVYIHIHIYIHVSWNHVTCDIWNLPLQN